MKKSRKTVEYWIEKYINLVAQIPEHITARNGQNLKQWAMERIK